MPEPKALFFTGKRPKDLVGYDPKGYGALIQYLAYYLDTLVPEYGRFISGGAQGFDQLAFKAVDSLKIRHAGMPYKISNELVLPFPGQEDLWGETGLFSKTDYRAMLRDADRIDYTVPAKPADRWAIAKALTDRNTDMLSRASMCIGIWPEGQPSWQNSAMKGGTADALRKADRAGIAMRVIKYRIESGEVRPVRVEHIR